MRSAARVLVALLVGLAAGIGVASSHTPLLARAAAAIEPIGTLWINAVRMTVVPLVVALVITGVASTADPRRIGRLGGYAIPVFVFLLLATGAFAALVTPFSLDRLAIAPQVAASLRLSASSVSTAESVRQMPTLLQRVLETIPINPLKAAVDGAMLPLVVCPAVITPWASSTAR